jgi:hypothetical protein
MREIGPRLWEGRKPSQKFGPVLSHFQIGRTDAFEEFAVSADNPNLAAIQINFAAKAAGCMSLKAMKLGQLATYIFQNVNSDDFPNDTAAYVVGSVLNRCPPS